LVGNPSGNLLGYSTFRKVSSGGIFDFRFGNFQNTWESRGGQESGHKPPGGKAARREGKPRGAGVFGSPTQVPGVGFVIPDQGGGQQGEGQGDELYGRAGRVDGVGQGDAQEGGMTSLGRRLVGPHMGAGQGRGV